MGNSIGVVGAGTMGSGIAQVAALGGHTVIVYDIEESALERGLKTIRSTLEKSVEKGKVPRDKAETALQNIRMTVQFNELQRTTTVIEAASERFDIKKGIFQRLDDILSHESVIATNTSSLSITALGSVTKRPDRVAGMHFFNPVYVMKLVEIIKGQETSETTINRIRTLAKEFGKTPVIAGDTPGFIVNRIARPFYGEALRLLGEGVADVETIDRIVKKGGGFRMGPFELMDLIGIDVNYSVSQSVYEQFFHEPRYRPHPIQRRMVEANLLGRKTGKGFYTYDKE
jgi:3-hydroxybutyryl-CoA dehydrogenase